MKRKFNFGTDVTLSTMRTAQTSSMTVNLVTALLEIVRDCHTTVRFDKVTKKQYYVHQKNWKKMELFYSQH